MFGLKKSDIYDAVKNALITVAIMMAVVVLSAQPAAAAYEISQAWDATISASDVSATAITADGGIVYAAAGSSIYSYSASGLSRWTYIHDSTIAGIACDAGGDYITIWDAGGNVTQLADVDRSAHFSQEIDPVTYGTLRNVSVSSSGDVLAITNLAAFLWDATGTYRGYSAAPTGAFLDGGIAADGSWAVIGLDASTTVRLYRVNSTTTALDDTLRNVSWDYTWAAGSYTYTTSVSHIIDGSALSAPVTDYQMVYWIVNGTGASTGNKLYTNLNMSQADFDDVAFYAGDYSTLLPFNITRYNTTYAQAIVKIPTITDAATGAVFVVKMGNPTAASVSVPYSSVTAVQMTNTMMETATTNSSGHWYGYWRYTAGSTYGSSVAYQAYLPHPSWGTAPYGTSKSAYTWAYRPAGNAGGVATGWKQKVTLPAGTYRILADVNASVLAVAGIGVQAATAAIRIESPVGTYTTVWDRTHATGAGIAPIINTTMIAGGATVNISIEAEANNADAGGITNAEILWDNLRILKGVLGGIPTDGAWGSISRGDPVPTRIHYDTQAAVTGTVATIDTARTGDAFGVQTSSRTYVYTVAATVPATMTAATTIASPSAGTPNGIVLSTDGGIIAEIRGLTVDLYSRDSSSSLGQYVAGGTFSTLGITANGLYAFAGGSDGLAYFFDKFSTSSYELLEVSDTGDPVLVGAIDLSGAGIIVGRSAGALEYYAISRVVPTTGEPQFAPNQVRFYIKTALGAPIEGATVTAQGMNTTAGDLAWLYQLLGISYDETPILNASMSGVTGSDGSIAFVMDPTVYYTIDVNKTGSIDTTMSVYPSDTEYVIYAGSFGFFEGGGPGELGEVNVSCDSYKINGTHGRITLRYNDTTETTVSVAIFVNQTNKTVQGAPQTTLTSATVGAVDSFSQVFDVGNLAAGGSMFVIVNATVGDYDDPILRTFAVTFEPEMNTMGGLPEAWMPYLGTFCILFGMLVFTQTTREIGCIVTCFIAAICEYGLGWFNDFEPGFSLCFVFAVLVSVAVIWANRSRSVS